MTASSTFRSVSVAALGATIALVFAWSGTALAQDVPTAKVVATINGEPITELDLAAATPDLRATVAQMPPDEQFAALLKGVIDIRLMARAAEAEAIDKQVETVSQLTYLRDRALRNAYLQTRLAATVTDEAIKARYDAELAKFVADDEIHAVHILVATEEEAKAIVAKLDEGGDFAAIAKEKSADTGSGANGGDLGFFGHGAVVKPFEEAAYALDVGAYTKTPVKTDFGWHVIKVLEKRKQPAPTLEQRHDTLRGDLAREYILAEIARLHAAATIVIVPTEPAAAPAASPPADAAPPPAQAPAQ